MSNYPPPPPPRPSTYEFTFNSNGHIEPQVGNLAHDPPQYAFPSQNSLFLYGQGQTNGMPTVPRPNTNSHSLRSNVQNVTTSTSENEVNQAPYVFNGGQVRYSDFQPPGYLPPPFTHKSPPYGARLLNQPSTDLNLSSSPNNFTSSVHTAAGVQSPNLEDSDTIPPVSSELEDGELDDGEVGKAMSQTGANTAAPPRTSQHQQHENVVSAHDETGHRIPKTINEPLPGLIQGSLTAPVSQKFTISHPQQLFVPNNSIGVSDNKTFSRPAENTCNQLQLSKDPSIQSSREEDQHSIDLRIEEAKQALRDLHSRGFDFNRIVKEGLNPDTLRKLYDETKVPLTSSSDLLPRKMMEIGLVDVGAETAPDIGVENIKDWHTKVSQKDSNGDIIDIDKSPYLATGEVKVSSQPAIAAMKNGAKLKSNQFNTSKSAMSSKANLPGENSSMKAGEKKTLDRKEYIARMLAAKTGKPAINASKLASPETSVTTDSDKSAQVQSAAAAAAIVPTTVQQAANELLDNPSGIQNEDLDAEAKRKAQTDLARQKIEALKFREGSSRQDRSASSSNIKKINQETSTNGISNILAERSDSIPRPLPSRQSSYFSPASQKPPFSIPGLFMTSDSPKAASPSQPLASEVFVLPSQGVGLSTSRSSQEDLHPQAAALAQSPVADELMGLPKVSSDPNPVLSATNPTTFSTDRKRQKAPSVIDSPSTRVRKPLGQQEENSVIIDISDDDISNNHSGDESPSTEEVTSRRDSLPKKSPVTNPGNGKEKSTRSVLPLYDIPQNKKAVVKMLPATQTSGQSGDLKDLKSKEMEIEAINRKIAELEQRIATKAKQTTSRNHSPRTSRRVTVSPPLGEASQQINNAMKLPLDVPYLPNGDFAHIAKKNEMPAAEQLNAERQLEIVERAKAEVEHFLAAENSLPSAAGQKFVQEDLQIPQAEEDSSLREGRQRSKGEVQEQVQDGEERHYVKMRSQKACEEETISGELEANRSLHIQEGSLAQRMQQERSQEQERKISLEDQRQARKSEIESGLPVLDAEVERTRRKLELLRQEMAGLEAQLQKGIEGRQGLLEELNRLSRYTETMPRPMDLDPFGNRDVPKHSTSSEEISAVTNPSALVDSSSLIQFSTVVEHSKDVREKHSLMRNTGDQISDGEIEEDVMDISRSDVDEVELSLYSPKSMSEVHDTSGFIDDDENYEPPSEINITQRQEPDPNAVLICEGLEPVKVTLPVKKQNQPFADQGLELGEKPTSGDPPSTACDNIASDDLSRQSPTRSPSPADASDPDEYEPPEPAPLGEEVTLPPRMSKIVHSERELSPPDVETNDSIARANWDSMSAVHQQTHKLELKRRVGLFTPYESPLKQFKSFRYHPHYLEEVSSGFRSLTYSHTIDPDIPLCRYELDGVCNDDSCQSQHLRNVGLSDDKILVDLGAKPDGSSPEFGNGLREIIHDIRARKIRDFNTVAGEITAYRARFLGDSSKVLPLQTDL